MKKIVLLYGLLGGLLVAALKLTEYRFLVVEHSLDLYGGIVALLSAAVGIWLGSGLKQERAPVWNAAAPIRVARATDDRATRQTFGITPRELEILTLIAAGLSNREIAQRLFVSENTVKTHSSRVFAKLNARRRTQAVQIAKEAGLIA